MPNDPLTLIILGSLGLAIGFVGGLLGLVLGVLRFPLILTTTGGAGVSAAMVAGTNIGISTLGAITAAIRHFRQDNVHDMNVHDTSVRNTPTDSVQTH